MSEERFRIAFDHAPIGIALVAPDGSWLRVNATLCEMTGYAAAELLARCFQDITHRDDVEADLEQVHAMLAGEIRMYEMEKRYLRADGSVLWALLSVSLVRDGHGRPLYFISQIQDIGERKRAHSELERLARHDVLTGALNRRGWDEELAQAIDDACHGGQRLGIALLDLNDFKQLNDSYGHAAGDRLLVEAVRGWQAHLRASDRLARVGGDEFAVLLPDCSDDQLDAIARRLRRAVNHAPGCAIGTARWSAGMSPDELVRRADRALYDDKQAPARHRPASSKELCGGSS